LRVTHARALRGLAKSLAAEQRRTSAHADRVETLVAEGRLEDADVEVSKILLDVMVGKGGGTDQAAVRVTAALTMARAERGLHEDVELGLGALDALVDKIGREAAELGDSRLNGIADALDAAGQHDGGRRAREIAKRFAKRHERLRLSGPPSE
jgi:hypothetical protein